MPTTKTIAKALRIVSHHDVKNEVDDIESFMAQAADRMEELEAANDNYRLHRECVEAIREFEVEQVFARGNVAKKYAKSIDSITKLRRCVWREIQEWEERQ